MITQQGKNKTSGFDEVFDEVFDEDFGEVFDEVSNEGLISTEVKRLNKKAELTRSCHSELVDDLRKWSLWFSAYVTLGSGIGTITIFAKIPDEYFILWGLFMGSIFLVSSIPSIYNFNKEIEDRSIAINMLGKWIRDAQNFGNIEILEMSKEQAIKRQKELMENYKEIMDKSPTIPNKKFLKLKQNHLQKVAISKEMDNSPFLTIEEIKAKLRTNGLPNKTTDTNFVFVTKLVIIIIFLIFIILCVYEKLFSLSAVYFFQPYLSYLFNF